MTYTSKFDIGQEVWLVRNERFQRIVKCSACGHSGKIVINGEELICPKCSGRSAHAQYVGQKHYVYDHSQVGKIEIEDHPSRYGKETPNPRVKYMVFATGVGSGQVWDEEDLFPTEAEAQACCDRRNTPLPVSECELMPAPADDWGKVL